MTKSCIKFKGVKSNSEAHNLRNETPNYLIPSEVENIHIVDFSVAEKRAELEQKYFERVGQIMQKKAEPIREAVLLLPNSDNDENLSKIFALNKKLEQNYGIKAFQIHIHNDEGFVGSDKKKYNYHAHILYDFTGGTGKNVRLKKKDLADIQTLTAEIMEIERGEFNSKNLHLNHHQFRAYKQMENNLSKKIDLKKEQKIELRKIAKYGTNKDLGRGIS